jgi:SAM-dependent methyltransferase
MAINVLEHIFETRKLLSEINRVLTTGGLFSGDSRNRFDLFFPEPHVNIRWLGLLPRSWVRPYVRWRKDIDYDEMHARLLSYRELRSALASTFGDNWLVVIPELSVYGVSGWIKNLVTTLDTIVHPLMIRLSPSHWVLARCHKA